MKLTQIQDQDQDQIQNGSGQNSSAKFGTRRFKSERFWTEPFCEVWTPKPRKHIYIYFSERRRIGLNFIVKQTAYNLFHGTFGYRFNLQYWSCLTDTNIRLVHKSENTFERFLKGIITKFCFKRFTFGDDTFSSSLLFLGLASSVRSTCPG